MIRVGTCSWAEKTLIKSGEFYPPKVKSAEERLRYYAEHFHTVEVDSSYYAIPLRSTASLWAVRTPDGFVFHIKVYGALTGHGVDPRTIPPEVRRTLPKGDVQKPRIYIKDKAVLEDLTERLIDALIPLKEAGKLGLLVYQYPPWFHYGPKNIDFIHQCQRQAKGHRMAVEFRHGSWLAMERAPEVLKLLRDSGLTYITADEPQYGTRDTVPFIPAVTSDTAYFRLHGRNRENWLKKGVATSLRYAYLYSGKELRAFVPPVREAENRTKVAYVMFNNCHGGFAVRNAREMEALFATEKDK